MVPTCIVCGSTDTGRSIFGGYRFLGQNYYRLRCAHCGFIFVDPIPTEATFTAMYDDSYFADYYGGGAGVGYEHSADAALVRADAILSRIKRHVPSGSLLDIGCAGGYFLAAAEKRGFRGLGIELNPQMAEHARGTFGLEVLNGSFESTAIESSGRQFDVIYMGDSLEHLPEPKTALARVSKVLAPGGVFVLNGPITLNRSLFMAVLRLKLLFGKGRSEWYVDGPPHHLWEWDARTMRRFLVGNGLDVLELTTSEEPGRPKKVVSDALKRPLTWAETAALGLKNLSAWSTNSLFAGLEWGDRVIAICRQDAVSRT